MQSSTRLMILVCILGCSAVAIGQDPAAYTENVLYNFAGGSDGSIPGAALTADAAGNLYGTTAQGGAFGAGTVFELVRSKTGWTHQVLYTFTGNTDGAVPSSGVVLDRAGNLYGTTSNGGTNYFGNVYELSPTSGGGWSESVLYSFVGGLDGQFPYGGVVFDKAGNLYGTTFYGGSTSACAGSGCGTVYLLTPNQSGGWGETVLYGFNGADGAFPQAGLVLDFAGNLYGTTSQGGTSTSCQPNGCGVAFELANSNGSWTETVLHNFYLTNQDGYFPQASLTLHGGHLFGVTLLGGRRISGTVFELTDSQSGWSERVIYSFRGKTDGSTPVAGVAFDKSGNLYGTTKYGGGSGCLKQGCGTAFELTSSGSAWVENQLYSFSGGSDGSEPTGGLLLDKAGNLYGTSAGGSAGYGVVFELEP
jgi:uncharacterized repeat protein (TIGR03803 family)